MGDIVLRETERRARMIVGHDKGGESCLRRSEHNPPRESMRRKNFFIFSPVTL